MQKVNRWWMVMALLASGLLSHAQDEFGGHPAGLHWQIMRSEAVRVIYPVGMEAQARRVANVINYMNAYNRRSIGDRFRRFDMILQNQTVVSNGYVGMAPLRSEFFVTPPQSSHVVGSTDWLDALAIHEYRHVQQNLNSDYGLTRWAHWLQGEGAWSVMSHLSAPDWYWEGDAVVMETALTFGGRGRAPFFTQEQRALAYADRNFSYLKHRNGSFRDLLPTHYPLGHLMLTHARQMAGNDVTATVFRDGTSYRKVVYPFSRAMHQHTGLNTRQLYAAAWNQKKQEWQHHIDSSGIIPTTSLHPEPKVVTDYRFPKYLNDSTIVVWKTSYRETDQIVILREGKDSVLTWPGFHLEDYFAASAEKLAWTEMTRNPRRGYQRFSEIVTFDLKTRQKKRLTYRSKYFSPAFSPNGGKIAAVHISPLQQNSLHVLDTASGTIQQTIIVPGNPFLSRPVWHLENSIICIARQNHQMTFIQINLADSSHKTLMPWTFHTLEAPFVHSEALYFTASFSGIDNIYRLPLDGSGSVFQVSSVPVGAYDPVLSPDGRTLLMTEFTHRGHVLSQQLVPTTASPITWVEPSEMPIFQTVANHAEGGSILDKVPDETFETAPYTGLFTGLKLHSWGLEPYVSTPTVKLLMNNLLNDVAIGAGGGLLLNEQGAAFYDFSIDIARWYPVLGARATSAQRAGYALSDSNTLHVLRADERIALLSISLPLRWLVGNYSHSLRATTSYSWRSLRQAAMDEYALPDRSFGVFQIELSQSTLHRQAYQNLGPKFGLTHTLLWSQSTDGRNSHRVMLRGALYTRGLWANHNIRLTYGTQTELLRNTYQFADSYDYPRGFATPVNDRFRSLGINYTLPLAYPDWGVAGITYFKRVRTNLFYDLGTAEIEVANLSTTYRSTGIELVLDDVWFNVQPVSLGYRYSFLLTDDPIIPNQRNNGTFFVEISW